MPYTISVTVRNKRLRDELYEFLQRVYLPWQEIIEDDEEEPAFIGPLVDHDLDDNSGLRIGFEYRACEAPEREYHYAVMRWIALQAGKRRSHFRTQGTLPQAVPFVVYDDIETSPVFVDTEWLAEGGAPGPMVDPLGLYLDDHIARELAWLYLPHDAYMRVSLEKVGCGGKVVEEALIQEGLDGAYCYLSIVREHVKRLDTLWRNRFDDGT